MDSTPTLDPPTDELTAPLAAPSTARCAHCGTRMAPDQRYCLECGERRTGGGLRDALPRTQAPAPAAAPKRGRMSPNSSLIAGIATLLIALGVGVLIGRTGDDNPGRASTPQIVTVSGAAAGGAGTATDTARATSSKGSRSKSASKSKKKAADSKAKVTGVSSAEETAKKNGVKLPPRVVKVGQKCEQGTKGCEGGKFTGNFFGGG